LAHQFPFAFIDQPGSSPPAPETIWVRLTAAQSQLRDHAELSPWILVELIAQAAGPLLGLRATTVNGMDGMLAGIDDFELAPELGLRPLVAGDVLAVKVSPLVRLGGLVKIEGTVRRGEAVVAHGFLSLIKAT
jgi:hypothetical protein